MTPTEINAINRTLAGFVGKDAHYFKPALCRNDLAEVAAKLTDDQWSEVEIRTRARSSLNGPCSSSPATPPKLPR